MFNQSNQSITNKNELMLLSKGPTSSLFHHIFSATKFIYQYIILMVLIFRTIFLRCFLINQNKVKIRTLRRLISNVGRNVS